LTSTSPPPPRGAPSSNLPIPVPLRSAEPILHNRGGCETRVGGQGVQDGECDVGDAQAEDLAAAGGVGGGGQVGLEGGPGL
jgi:hypothetical protein